MPKLGRVRPVQIVDDKTNGFLHLYFANGRHTAVARMGKHYSVQLDAAAPPDTVDYASNAQASLSNPYLNNTLQDCVIAGKDHLVGVFTGNESGPPAVASDSEVQADYVAFCGAGDQGCIITDVLNMMRTTGMLLSGQRHTIANYVAVDSTNQNLVRVAVDLFGGLTLGINLPNSWFQNHEPGFVWDVPPIGDQSIGGHDISVVGYNGTGVQISTWGVVGTMTWAALATTTWIEECYALLSPDWTANGDLAPNGIDAGTLAADLALIASGQVPPVGTGLVPSPIPDSTPLSPGYYRLASGCTATVSGDIVDVQGP